MKAKKCDICGGYYDKSDSNVSIEISCADGITYDTYEVCPYCFDDIADFIKLKQSVTEGDINNISKIKAIRNIMKGEEDGAST